MIFWYFISNVVLHHSSKLKFGFDFTLFWCQRRFQESNLYNGHVVVSLMSLGKSNLEQTSLVHDLQSDDMSKYFYKNILFFVH